MSENWIACPVCNGVGYVRTSDGAWPECNICDGAGRIVLPIYPRCKTCAHWNELLPDAKHGDTYLVGYCEHPHIRTQHEKMSKRSDSAAHYTEDPTFWFWPGEDFGCVLHSVLDTKTRTPNVKRLKITGDFAESIKTAMKAGVPK